MAGAEQSSEKLVTVRALESTLELSADEAEPGTLETGWEQRLEEVRTRVNELDDRRGEINEELRQINEKIDRVAPFAELGIDLDLLSGYETVTVLVGEGPSTRSRRPSTRPRIFGRSRRSPVAISWPLWPHPPRTPTKTRSTMRWSVSISPVTRFPTPSGVRTTTSTNLRRASVNSSHVSTRSTRSSTRSRERKPHSSCASRRN